MPEECKLKYLKVCKNQKLVYKIIDEWNVLLQHNSLNSIEEKLQKLEDIKNQDINLYQLMKEDINDGLY